MSLWAAWRAMNTRFYWSINPCPVSRPQAEQGEEDPMAVRWMNHAWEDDPNLFHWWSPSRIRMSLPGAKRQMNPTGRREDGIFKGGPRLTLRAAPETTKERGWYCTEIILIKTPLPKIRRRCRANQYVKSIRALWYEEAHKGPHDFHSVRTECIDHVKSCRNHISANRRCYSGWV